MTMMMLSMMAIPVLILTRQMQPQLELIGGDAWPCLGLVLLSMLLLLLLRTACRALMTAASMLIVWSSKPMLLMLLLLLLLLLMLLLVRMPAAAPARLIQLFRQQPLQTMV